MNFTSGSRLTWFSIVWISFVVLLCLSLGEGFYSFRLERRLARMDDNFQRTLGSQGETIQQLSRSLEMARRSFADLQGEINFAKDRLGMTQVQLRRAQQSAAELSRQQNEAVQHLGQIQQQQAATEGTVGTLTSDLAGMKDEFSSTQQKLETTRSDLQRVIGDLGVQSDLIARNRGELDELKQRGERNYYEFDLAKSKQPYRVGDVAISLKKTDTKAQRYAINLIADDRTIEKKDKTVNEPVQFYQSGLREPSEIVVNQIFKDRIVGYLSTPKKKEGRTTLTEGGASQRSKTSS